MKGSGRFFLAALAAALILTTAAGAAAPSRAKKASKGKGPMAIITMEKGGQIEIELYPDSAPKTVENFTTLAGKGFYNGLTFHRVEPGFVVQGGDPEGSGRGGPGYTIKAEFSERPHKRGTLAMARSSDPDSAGSQFYICLAPAPFLDGKYTVFGQVVSGMDAVDGIRIGDKMKSIVMK
jgi:peptidylprolyl isomerase/peptidyl-prolyl cis-trans isomerase B (cyclophilin B)